MSALRDGRILGPLLGVLWTFTACVTVAVVLAFSTGEGFRPGLIGVLILGVAAGLGALRLPVPVLAGAAVVLAGLLTLIGLPPIRMDAPGTLSIALAVIGGGLATGWPLSPLLSKWYCRRLDVALGAFAKTRGVTYTRYVDDLSFSHALDWAPQ